MNRTRLILALVAAALVVAALLFGPTMVRSYFTTKTELRVEKGQAQAGIDAGAEAGNAITSVITNEQASNTETGTKALWSAGIAVIHLLHINIVQDCG